ATHHPLTIDRSIAVGKLVVLGQDINIGADGDVSPDSDATAGAQGTMWANVGVIADGDAYAGVGKMTGHLQPRVFLETHVMAEVYALSPQAHQVRVVANYHVAANMQVAR